MGPVTTPFADPGWQAARNGLPGDSTAVSHAAQVAQFLAAHAITPVYAGVPLVFADGLTGTGSAPLDWVNLGQSDIDQPFTMPAGATAVGRVTLPLAPAGNGADVTVSLCADSGGSPGTVLASTVLPASHLAQLAATAGLASAGPLATAQSNAAVFTSAISAGTPWTSPAVSVNGAGDYAAPVSSGNYIILLGGFDHTGTATISAVSTVAYLGAGTMAGPVPQPSLPQGAWNAMAAATTDTVIFAGGINATSFLKNVWTASWDPSTGTVGAWTAQTALPAPVVAGGMATWGSTVYVAGGNSNDTSATGTSNVWRASVVNGQIQGWTACPPLPLAVSSPYVAAVNGWLIAAGGANTSGTAVATWWYAQINTDGSLGEWQSSPNPLPLAAYAYSPGWNLAVTDTAMAIVSGASSSGNLAYVQQVAVSSDGPASVWQVQQEASSVGTFQVGCFPSGAAGQWEAVVLTISSYSAFPLGPVPQVSVPLPASGLTPGGTYHIVLHQDGGDAADYAQAALDPGALAATAKTRPNSGGSWTALPDAYSLITIVYDQTPGGQPLHLWQDSGARIVSFVWAAGSGALLGALESTLFPSGSPETVLASVTEVTYGSNGLPSGLVQLA